MNWNSKLKSALFLVLIIGMLHGCRAMYTHDIDGTHYQNEQRSFYAPEKEAKLKRFSHAYRWVSDDINGHCSHIDGSQLKNDLPAFDYVTKETSFPVDTIYLDTVALFPTDKNKISKPGEALLEQTIERLQEYEDILHITVSGHADYRGSTKYNQNLSMRRAERIANAIRPSLKETTIHVQAFGELHPLIASDNPNDLEQNRRVSLSAVVKDTSPSNNPRRSSSSNTLCFTNSKEPELQSANEDFERTQARIQQSLQPPTTSRPPLSAGDRVRITIPRGEELSGVYEVSMSGVLEIPFAGFIQAQGRNTRQLETDIHDRLIAEEIFMPGMLKVSTTVQEWAPVDIVVSGATFDPGRVTINQQDAENRQFKQTQLSGDYARDRLLSAALRSAGGIRPDADLRQIKLYRQGEVKTIDIHGLFDGTLTNDVALAAGDQVVVPSTGYFQPELVRLSQVTPPGMRIFISNLTVPADNNAKSAINQDTASIPYGTRFLQGLVSSNCVGGTQLTNASRRAILISRNPITNRTEVIERSIQQLVSDPQRDEINPFLMPNDGIACYDSGFTNFRDVTGTFFNFLAPILDINGL